MTLLTATLEFSDPTKAQRATQALEGQTIVVRDKQVRVAEEAPPLPYITLDLLEDAALHWSWSGRKTMAEAQTLFEQGLITYPRTDSTEVDPEAVQAVRIVIVSLYGDKALPGPGGGLLARMRSRRTGEPDDEINLPASGEAHEAIRPTDPGCLSGELQDLSQDAIDLYHLIWQRFLASQMRPARYQVIEATFEVTL